MYLQITHEITVEVNEDELETVEWDENYLTLTMTDEDEQTFVVDDAFMEEVEAELDGWADEFDVGDYE